MRVQSLQATDAMPLTWVSGRSHTGIYIWRDNEMFSFLARPSGPMRGRSPLWGGVVETPSATHLHRTPGRTPGRCAFGAHMPWRAVPGVQVSITWHRTRRVVVDVRTPSNQIPPRETQMGCSLGSTPKSTHLADFNCTYIWGSSRGENGFWRKLVVPLRATHRSRAWRFGWHCPRLNKNGIIFSDVPVYPGDRPGTYSRGGIQPVSPDVIRKVGQAHIRMISTPEEL